MVFGHFSYRFNSK